MNENEMKSESTTTYIHKFRDAACMACLPVAQLGVLTALASFADKDTGICWPSYAKIMERVALKETALRGHINALVTAGWVVKLRQGSGGEGRGGVSNKYKLTIPGPEASEEAQPTVGRPTVGQKAERPTIGSPTVGQDVKPNSKFNRKLADQYEEDEAPTLREVLAAEAEAQDDDWEPSYTVKQNFEPYVGDGEYGDHDF